MATSTVVNKTRHGDEEVKSWPVTEYMADNEAIWCLIKCGREYTILHRRTGLALPHIHRIQRIAKQRLAIIMDGVDVWRLNTTDASKVVDAIGKDRKRAYDKACKPVDPFADLDPYREICEEVKEHFGLDDDMEATVTVKQIHAPYATHEYTVTADDVINGHHCCGPCECHIEPDGVCRNGWPGTEDALARC